MRALVIVLALACAGPALAEPPKPPSAAAKISEEARALAGPFEIIDGENRRRCAVALEAKGAALAATLDPATCLAAMPFLSGVVAWAVGPAGAIRLLDGGGRVLAEFGETEDGVYELARAGDGIFFLSRAGAEDAEAAGPTPADLAGTWTMARQPGRPICTLTLDQELAAENAFRLSLAKGCDQAITRFDPVSWRIERSDVVLLSSRGDQIRFERGEDDVWHKVPEAGRPLLLTR